MSKEKRRYFGADSAVALPHIVGCAVGADEPPRLHSFAWNVGVRAERKPVIDTALASFTTLEDCRRLSSVYFATVHPMFAFLSREAFWEKLQQRWGSIEAWPNFAAVVAAAAAVGSFFADSSPEREAALVEYSFRITDLALSTPVALPDLDSVAGWILRTLYVRLTTRPIAACLASQNAMHLAEILGLHREVSGRQTGGASDQALFSDDECELRRRHYWVARCLNGLLSIEYGLCPVRLSYATCAPPCPSPDTHIEQLVSMARILDPAGEEGPATQAMRDRFSRLQSIPDKAAVVSFFKAEVCIGMLRQLVSASIRPGEVISGLSVSVLARALDATCEMLAAHCLWWNLVSVPFQTVCICLYSDSSVFLSLLPAAMDALRAVAGKVDTHLAREALVTAQHLVTLSRDKTEERLKLKSMALGDSLPSTSTRWPSFDQAFDLEDWWLDAQHGTL